MTNTKTFRNCQKFTYVCTNWDNIVYEHHRIDNGKWFSEKRDRYGNRIETSIRTDQELEPIFNHVRSFSECNFYSLSSLSDFSPYS